MKTRRINDTELMYEIILSKGLGYLTADLEIMLYMVICNLSRKFQSRCDKDLIFDQIQDAYIIVSQNVFSFNEEKYSKALPWATEVAKRSFAKTFNKHYKIGHIRMNNINL